MPYTFLNVGPVVGGTPTTDITDNNTNSFQEYDFANKTHATFSVSDNGALLVMFASPAAGLTDTYLNADAANEHVEVEGTPAGTTTHVDTGSGSGNTTQIGTSSDVSNQILGNVDAQSTGGSNALIVFDQGETTAETYTIAGSKITSSSFPATIDFSGGGNTTLIINSAGLGDTYSFTGPCSRA